MSSILKNEIHYVIAKSFYGGILNRTISAYFFLGRTLPWNVDDIADTADQTLTQEYDARNNIVTMRRILDTEVSYARDRVDWTSGTVYDMYDDSYSTANPAPSGATTISDANMFVMTDEFNIYKCISNNYGAPSTQKPTGTSLSYITLADGYVWKYMMPISILSQNRFLSPQFMPLQNSITDSFFSPGLTPILISGGSGYVEDNTLIQVLGDGSGAIFEPVIVDGEITNINVINPGAGYTNAQVFISTPDPNKAQGTGAEIEIDLNTGNLASSQSDVQLSAVDGELSFVYITNAGGGYTSAPTVTIDGDGTGATASATVVDGLITNIVITNRGSGYTWAEATITGGGGTGGTARVIIAPTGGHGHNVIEEATPRTLVFYMDTTEDTNQGLDGTNDYRQAGMIINPDRYSQVGTRLLFTGDRGSAVWKVNSPSNLVVISKDDVVYRVSDREEFTIIEIEGSEVLMQSLTGQVISVTDTFEDIDNIPLFTIDAVSEPEVDKFSGTMIYVDNKPPYREEADQNVILKTYISF